MRPHVWCCVALNVLVLVLVCRGPYSYDACYSFVQLRPSPARTLALDTSAPLPRPRPRVLMHQHATTLTY